MMEVLEGGIQTTIQDFPGRQGLLDQGICPAGPFDNLAFRLANVLVGLEMGITTYDSSVGGLGGCPYAPGAAGNLATEDLVYFLAGMGLDCGIDLERVRAASNALRQAIAINQPSRVLAALNAVASREA